MQPTARVPPDQHNRTDIIRYHHILHVSFVHRPDQHALLTTRAGADLDTIISRRTYGSSSATCVLRIQGPVPLTLTRAQCTVYIATARFLCIRSLGRRGGSQLRASIAHRERALDRAVPQCRLPDCGPSSIYWMDEMDVPVLRGYHSSVHSLYCLRCWLRSMVFGGQQSPSSGADTLSALASRVLNGTALSISRESTA